MPGENIVKNHNFYKALIVVGFNKPYSAICHSVYYNKHIILIQHMKLEISLWLVKARIFVKFLSVSRK
jgi:hypothetical protein